MTGPELATPTLVQSRTAVSEGLSPSPKLTSEIPDPLSLDHGRTEWSTTSYTEDNLLVEFAQVTAEYKWARIGHKKLTVHVCVLCGRWSMARNFISNFIEDEKECMGRIYMPKMDYCTCQQVQTHIHTDHCKVRTYVQSMYMNVSHLIKVLLTLGLCSECVMTLQTEMSTVSHPNATMVVHAIWYHTHDMCMDNIVQLNLRNKTTIQARKSGLIFKVVLIL